MKDVTLATVVLFMVLLTSVFTLTLLWVCSDSGYTGIDNEMKSHLHEQVIIQQDTMIIINYSITYNEYYLSDGRTISSNFIK